MIEVNKKDYVVVQTYKEDGSPKKPQLIKVTGIRAGGEVLGVLEHDPHIKQVSIEAKQTEVILNLGKKPKDGEEVIRITAKISFNQ